MMDYDARQNTVTILRQTTERIKYNPTDKMSSSYIRRMDPIYPQPSNIES